MDTKASPTNLLADLETLQEQLIDELDALNLRVEKVLAESQKYRIHRPAGDRDAATR
jgi:hypothetical protein